MKLAILTSGDPYYRMGSFNNVHERIKHVQNIEGVETTAFVIRFKDDWLFKLIRKKYIPMEDVTEVDGLKYHNLWLKHRLVDSFVSYQLNMKDMSGKSQLSEYIDQFKNFDLLSVHAKHDMYLAYLVKVKYNIPFVMTWHGSDINLDPFKNKKIFNTTKLIIENADWNYFVSKALMKASNKIAITDNKEHLYTGPADIYTLSPTFNRKEAKEKIGVQSKLLIGFIGNMNSIKNVFSLVDIFEKLNKKHDDISFITLGGGELLTELKERFANAEISNIQFKGVVEPEDVPQYMAALDFLVLPSRNEGMPRVVLEAQALGVHVVGSDVGGIPEAIGTKNCFPLDEKITDNISSRISEIIDNKEEKPTLSEEFSWGYAVDKELSRYRSILNAKQ